MREFSTCEGVCRERKVELVSGGAYDDLATDASEARARIETLLPIVVKLAGVAVLPADDGAFYESVRGRARLALRAPELPGSGLLVDAALSAEPTVVWRCPDCGGLEETQPCIGVCIWRAMDWVELGAFERERVQVLRDIELERALFELVTRFARVTPRVGEWERNWRAFRTKATLLLEQ